MLPGIRGRRQLQIKDLTPNRKNPRTITDDKLAQLKKALTKFGDLSGFVFNRKTNHLVGGHQRQKIFDDAVITITKKYSRPTKAGTVSEGYAEFKGEKFSFREVYWDENLEKAANIAANKGAGEWDLPQLSEWIKDLNNFDLDFDMSLTMLDAHELKQFGGITVAEHTRSEATGVEEDEIPEVKEAKTKLGDLYKLGNHRLLCGDSTDILQVEKLMNGEKADMVFTDPPYGMNLDTNYARTNRVIGKSYKPVLGDNQDFDPGTIFGLFDYVNEIFLWGADYYCQHIPKGGAWTVWDKKKEDLDESIGTGFELCWSKQPHKRMLARFLWSGFTAKEKNETRVHPTQKPVALCEWFFNRWGKPEDKVVDLFGGSGSTLIACEKTNRKCFMMELDPHYCDVIVARWEKYTGLKAKLVPRPKVILKKPVKASIIRHAKNH